MILKGFKENSIKKHLRSLLNNSEGISKAQVVDSVGVIVGADEFQDLEMFKSLSTSLHISSNKLKIISYTAIKKGEFPLEENCFNPKNIGWKGSIINAELETFLNTEFDLLISYYKTDLLHLKLLTAKSKARFKVSTFEEDERLNDLIIFTPLSDFNAFKTELLKYLQVFKILKHDT